jgi:hypothetical protein
MAIRSSTADIGRIYPLPGRAATRKIANRPMQRTDIIIAGGGVAGLGLALALKHAGGAAVTVAVYDPAFARKGADRRAFAIAAGARRMLETLGVWEAVADGAQPLAAMEITDSALEEPVRPLFLSFDGEVAPGEPFAHMVESGPLTAELRAACEAAGVGLSSAPVTGFAASPGHVDAAVAGEGEMGPGRSCASRPAFPSTAGTTGNPRSWGRFATSGTTRAGPWSTSSPPAPSRCCR